MGVTREAPLVLELDTRAAEAEPEATIELVGGKAAALARLASTGLPVPRGFCVTTAGYRRFVDAHALQAEISAAIDAATAQDAQSLERASATIRALFERHNLPEYLAEPIRRTYAKRGGEQHPSAADVPVAVRSSATAEDQSDASFAGQHDTYLNVRGEAAVLDAVRRCWASLWTPRAMAYRARQGIRADAVAMGVIVQQLVPADVSGVLFTANPVTGERGELVVNASLGLGEAIVAAEVTPDTYRIDRASLAIVEASIGDKLVQIAPRNGGGTHVLVTSDAQRTGQALPEARLRQLARLGLEIEAAFEGTPQDIEWALAADTWWILQARPITNVPPAPLRDVRWEPPVPGSAWIRRQVVENMPEPLSPLFAELYLAEGLDRSAEAIYRVFDVPSAVMRLVDRPLFTTVNGYAYMRGNINFTWSVVPSLLRAYVLGIRALFKVGPGYWRDNALPSYLATIERWKAVETSRASDAELLRGVRELAWADAIYWFAAAVAIGTAKVTDSILNGVVSEMAPRPGLTSSVFLRGFASKALEAEATLEALADTVRRSERLGQIVEATPARQLPQVLRSQLEGHGLADALDAYLDRFGHQIYNLDFAEPTQAEEPVAVLLSLQALVRTPARDIEARRQALARERDDATEAMARALDPPRRRLFRLVVGWAQKFSPYREEALFYVGAAWTTLRRFALELGRRLAEAGALDQAADIFFLETAEIQAASSARAAGRTLPDLARVARQRRELREARKRLHPPAAVPADYRLRLGPFDYSMFETQLRNVDDTPVLRGFGVSAGTVTAPASVVRSPAEFERMQPDSILVCPTTTPAWTPLFAQARGLVTDVGGILAHGSIVAREYAIPAVMGTGTATQRITHGELLRVDGDVGSVTLVERPGHSAEPEAAIEARTEQAGWWTPGRVIGVGLVLGLAAAVARSRRRRHTRRLRVRLRV